MDFTQLPSNCFKILQVKNIFPKIHNFPRFILGYMTAYLQDFRNISLPNHLLASFSRNSCSYARNPSQNFKKLFQSSSASTSIPSKKHLRFAFPFGPFPWIKAISLRTSWKGKSREAYWVKISFP